MNADGIRAAMRLWLLTPDSEGRSPYTCRTRAPRDPRGLRAWRISRQR